MLEICLPVSGLASISLTGVMTAFRERKMIPDVITGVSGGAWAAISAFGKCYDDGHGIQFTKMVRDHLISKPFSRFIPPFRKKGIPKKLLKYSMEHSSNPSYIKRLGLKHFYVGYTKIPSFEFVQEDVLKYSNREEIFHTIWKSSSLPFVTHYALHCKGALDGGLRKLVFSSPHKVKERWIISHYRWPLKFLLARKKYHRFLHVPSTIKLPFLASDRQIHEAFEVGYNFGYKVTF